jgi:hypothetical protein
LRLGFRLLPASRPTIRVVRVWTERRHDRPGAEPEPVDT